MYSSKMLLSDIDDMMTSYPQLATYAIPVDISRHMLVVSRTKEQSHPWEPPEGTTPAISAFSSDEVSERRKSDEARKEAMAKAWE